MNRAPYLNRQLDDIQAVLGVGFRTLSHSRFSLLTIGDPAAAREWLVELQQSGTLVSMAEANRQKGAVDEAAAVAFSFDGLGALGIEESEEYPFPTAFRSGMGSDLRRALLRDDQTGWSWADASSAGGQRQAAHVLLAHWWKPGVATRLPQPTTGAFRDRKVIDGPADFFHGDHWKEPFGFRDGIAQPVIYNLRDDASPGATRARRQAGLFYRDRVVAQGEFILGYRNEYDELSYVPNVAGWHESGLATHPDARFGLNASYLGVRQIEQDVDAFRKLECRVPPRTFEGGASLAEKMLGRRKDGTPLLPREGGASPLSDSQADAFRYQVADANGFGCPLGAHIRRANPRDGLGTEVEAAIASSKLHRLIRRGRPYREDAEGTPREGLFFIACNADLERQFEFVLQRWLHNGRFADLEDEDDPIIGPAPATRRFSAPQGIDAAASSIASFTRTHGGGYFFLPGLKALSFIAGAGEKALGSSTPRGAVTERDVRLVV